MGRTRRSGASKAGPSGAAAPGTPGQPPPFQALDTMVPGGTRLDTGINRDPYLPVIFQVTTHPLVPDEVQAHMKTHGGRILVYPTDTHDKAYTKFFLEYARTKLRAPQGPNAGISEKYGE